MIRTGILTKDDPMELLEGWLIMKMPKDLPHRLTTQLTREAISGLLSPGWFIDAQVVEVSDATIQRDPTAKKRIYAQAGLSVYRIINLLENKLEVYTNPSGLVDQPDYRRQQEYSPSDQVLLVIGGREVGQIKVEDLLP